jgi:hypothetical protein
MQLLGTHSNGTKFYYCKNCRSGGPESYFTKDFHISEILQDVHEPWVDAFKKTKYYRQGHL